MILKNLQWVEGLVWGTPLLILLLGVGLMLTVLIGGRSLTKIPYAFKQLFSADSSPKGTVSGFSALMMSLSATIGTGNIVGVATAISLGGPGALFWMWCSAILGMATKYSEAVLAVRFREKSASGEYIGGPMYYIKNGLGKRWLPLAFAFAFFGAFAGFGIGNMTQANSIADALTHSFSVDKNITAAVLLVLVGVVILGGVRRIAKVAKGLVPFMAVTYLAGGLYVLAVNVNEISGALLLVFQSAFTPVAAQGGFAGAVVAVAIQKGISRGVFSNEAGLGSAPIAHAAAKNPPVKQGLIAMLGTFIDTIIICSITGLAILVSGAWLTDGQGVALSQTAFSSALPYGDKIVTVSLCVFAFTTILGWCYYGERCVEFLVGARGVKPFRVLWLLAIPVGVLVKLEVVWVMSGILNGLMAAPNLIALVLLSTTVAAMSKEYFAKH